MTFVVLSLVTSSLMTLLLNSPPLSVTNIEKEYRGVIEKKSRHISQMSFTSSLPLESYIRTALSAGGEGEMHGSL